MTNEEIVAFYKSGYTRKKLRREFGLSVGRVDKALRHIPGAVTIPENQLCEQVISGYKSGLKISELVKIHKIDSKTIDNILYFYKIPKTRRRSVGLNQSFFETIDTEEKAYWLGFLYADGYNNEKTGSIELTLQALDLTHVELFKKAINSEHRISKKTINDRYICYRLSFCSRIMSDYLASHGCVQAKSLILEFPKILPDELINHFVRGYFDGDGSVSVNPNTKSYNFHILGTENFLEKTREYMGLSDTKLDKKGECYDLRYSGRQNLLKIKEYLYKDATIYLERKKQKFDMC